MDKEQKERMSEKFAKAGSDALRTGEAMDGFGLEEKFTDRFFQEFRFDAEFGRLFKYIAKGLTPFEAIEYLCRGKKELSQLLERVIENEPRKIIVTTEEFEQLKNVLTPRFSDDELKGMCNEMLYQLTGSYLEEGEKCEDQGHSDWQIAMYYFRKLNN